MRVKLLLQLKTDQSLSQERKKSRLSTVKKENPNLPAGQEKVVTEGAKGERTI